MLAIVSYDLNGVSWGDTSSCNIVTCVNAEAAYSTRALFRPDYKLDLLEIIPDYLFTIWGWKLNQRKGGISDTATKTSSTFLKDHLLIGAIISY